MKYAFWGLTFLVVYLVLGLATLWLRLWLDPMHFDAQTTGFHDRKLQKETITDRAIVHVVFWPVMLPATAIICATNQMFALRQRQLNAESQRLRELEEANEELERALRALP